MPVILTDGNALFMEWLQNLYHTEGLKQLIASGGIALLFFIIYAETGLFVGFFLPGDSLLVTAGLFAYTNPEVLNINHMILALCIAAIAGDNTGYWFGRKTGPRLYARPDSRLFKKHHLQRAHDFYEKHGAKTIFMARFVPIIRTFGPIAAGIAEMPYKRFLLFSVTGGIAWITSMSLLGYYLGSSIPGVEKKIDKVIIIVIAVSLLPMLIHYLQEKRKGKSAEEAVVSTVAPGLEKALDE